MRKNVLIVAYYFPPSGGPGVQRVLKHVQYLPDYGWNPIVLTVNNGSFPARDESLLAKIPSNIFVERTHIYEPYDLYRAFVGEKNSTALDVSVLTHNNTSESITKRIANLIRSTFFIPDARIGWLPTAVKAGKKLIDQMNIDALYSSSPPYTCSLIGRQLHRSSGLPWIAGLRDPWTEFLTTPKRWVLPRLIDQSLERSVLREADLVECAWEGIISDALRKHPTLPTDKFLHIPNGFDSNDFPAPPEKHNDAFTITYSGSLYGLRNPNTLLAALEALVSAGTIPLTKLCLRIVGRVGDDVLMTLKNSPLSSVIEIISYVPHSKSVEYLLQSDALLLIVDNAKESNEIVPGKVYEYLGTYKPIIALAPRGSAIERLLNETSSGNVFTHDDTVQCADMIREIYNRWQNSDILHTPNKDVIQRYERKNAARQLASALDTLVMGKQK